jgi:uncharacterized protein (DUF433 family)
LISRSDFLNEVVTKGKVIYRESFEVFDRDEQVMRGIARRYKMASLHAEHLLDRITIDPEVMVGKPTIRGLRITVEQILLFMAGNGAVNDLLDDYPELERQDVQAALLYASELVREEQVFRVEAG